MGLDITAYEMVVPWDEPVLSDEDMWDHSDALRVYSEFPLSLGSLKEGWYRSMGREMEFRAGSYGGYNMWREWLSVAALGVEPRRVWENPIRYRLAPFFHLVNFSDCEGTIGPEASATLAREFQAFGETQAFDDAASGDDWYVDLYRTWAEAFALAADTGCVRFH